MIALCGMAWNQAECTENWLASVSRSSSGHDVRLFLLDNGSADGAKMMRIFNRYAPVWTHRNNTNGSIYKAWNQLLVAALAHKPEYICLSNNDVIVSRGWLNPIIREFEKDPKRYFLPNGNLTDRTTFEADAARVSTEQTGITKPGRGGWCLFFTPDQVREFLPVPEELILWYGDDFVHRKLAAAGYRCETVMDCCVLHLGSVSFFRRSDYVKIVAKDRETYYRLTGERL